MRLLYSWLKEFLPDLDKSAEEVAELLTLHSFETVVAKKIAIHPAISAVKVEKINPHPNADRLKLATVNDGHKQIQVVCGATNYQVGDIVPYSPPGADLFDEDGQKFTVKEATIRGQVSPGMLNSPRELGLGDWHIGLWVLPNDTPLGTPLNQLIPDDAILEADITPNRAHDCLSHRGVAREIAALLKLSIIPSPQAGRGEGEEISGDYKIFIADPALAPRYMAAVLDNLTIKPSPLIMQFRLLASGTHPINNLVDITNYVMFELGQPVHLFDCDALPGKTIGVRAARIGEKITDFDNIEHTLSLENVVITVDDKVVALAGVTGALNTGITAKTTHGLLEIANFHPDAIQKSARAVNTRTEASARFSKGLDPNLAAEAHARCLDLLKELAGATVTQAIDNYPQPYAPQPISFRPTRPSQLAGTEISIDNARDALQTLRCVISEQGDTWQVTPPFDRLDLTGEHDLVEEVIRLFGLLNIPSRGPARHSPACRQAGLCEGGGDIREKLRDEFVKIGFIEVYNYSFETELIAQALGLINDTSLKLSNPVAPEQACLRQSLLPRLIENVVTNKAEWRKRASEYSRALFEISTVFKKGEGGVVPGVIEEERLAGITHDVPLTAVLAALRTVFGDKIATRPIASTAQWDKGTAEILLNEKTIGYSGTVSSPALLSLHEKLHLKPGLQAFEIGLNSAKI